MDKKSKDLDDDAKSPGAASRAPVRRADNILDAVGRKLMDLPGDIANQAVGNLAHIDLGKKFSEPINGALARQYVRGRELVERSQTAGGKVNADDLNAEDKAAVQAYQKVHNDLPKTIPFVDRDALLREVERHIEIKAAAAITPPKPFTPARESAIKEDQSVKMSEKLVRPDKIERSEKVEKIVKEERTDSPEKIDKSEVTQSAQDKPLVKNDRLVTPQPQKVVEPVDARSDSPGHGEALQAIRLSPPKPHEPQAEILKKSEPKIAQVEKTLPRQIAVPYPTPDFSERKKEQPHPINYLPTVSSESRLLAAANAIKLGRSFFGTASVESKSSEPPRQNLRLIRPLSIEMLSGRARTTVEIERDQLLNVKEAKTNPTSQLLKILKSSEDRSSVIPEVPAPKDKPSPASLPKTVSIFDSRAFHLINAQGPHSVQFSQHLFASPKHNLDKIEDTLVSSELHQGPLHHAGTSSETPGQAHHASPEIAHETAHETAHDIEHESLLESVHDHVHAYEQVTSVRSSQSRPKDPVQTFVVKDFTADKYITGTEVAFVAIMALASAARARPGEHATEAGLNQAQREYILVEEQPWLPSQNGNLQMSFIEIGQVDLIDLPSIDNRRPDLAAEKAVNKTPLENKDAQPKVTGKVLLRPQILVQAGDSLSDMAQALFYDSRLGHLIADLNIQNSRQSLEQNARIVRLVQRQRLSLPVYQDIMQYSKRLAAIGEMPLITVVDNSSIDREMLADGLSSMLGLNSKNRDPLSS